MLSSRTQSLLADYLKAVAEAENGVEITRLVLAEKKDFKPLSAFAYLDRLDKGYVNVRDLTEFLEDLDLVPLESHVRSYFNLYDSNDDSRLSFSDFTNAVLPATDLYLRESALSRPIFRSDQPLSYAASFALARVFEKDMQSNKSLEYRRKELVDRYDWDIYSAFRAIDQERYGYIDQEALSLFFDEVGALLTAKESDALLRRADKDRDGRIDLYEFKKLLQPVFGSDRQISAGSPSRKSRSPSPRRVESNSFSTPSKGKMISDSDYYRYLEESARLSSGKKSQGVSSPRRLSPRASSPRNKSPSLKKELTDYRVDSGYRTVRAYDNVENSRSSPRNNRSPPLSERGSQRSRSPRLRSEITDYRVSSNYRTVKAYDDVSSPQRESGRRSADRQEEAQRTPQRREYSGYDASYSSARKRSPVRYEQEPTKYREETYTRTVKVFDKNEEERPRNEEEKPRNEDEKPRQDAEEKAEPESGVKEAKEEPKEQKANEQISKKLEFAEPQQQAKGEKEQIKPEEGEEGEVEGEGEVEASA